MTPIPSYAVRLLLAAKSVVHPPANRNPEGLAEDLQSLEQAIIDFENNMPLVNGEILETDQ